MVVDADGVVAAAHETINDAVCEIVVEVVCREAEIDAVETLFFPRQTLELEMPVLRLEPAMLSCGCVL